MAANKKKKLHFVIGWFLFIVYLLVLLYCLFLAEGFGRGEILEHRYNLTLLKEISRYWKLVSSYPGSMTWIRLFLINVVGNVVAFIPYGFFLPMFMKKHKNIFTVTIFGALFSLAVELLQYMLYVGSFDVDDLLLNTLGTFLGACIYFAAVHHRKNKSGK